MPKRNLLFYFSSVYRTYVNFFLYYPEKVLSMAKNVIEEGLSVSRGSRETVNPWGKVNPWSKVDPWGKVDPWRQWIF